MDTDLEALKARLADCTDTEFNALIQATYRSPQSALLLLGRLDIACRWELACIAFDRRVSI